jgi:hypothetical protein
VELFRIGDGIARRFKGEGTPKKLATATQPQLPRNVTDFK